MTTEKGCKKPYFVGLFIISTKYGLRFFKLKFDQTDLINHITAM